MAKRFIDTGFYSSPFVRGLRGPYKALYSYLFLNCDHAGVWQVELDIAAMRLDQKRIDARAALEAFGGKVIELSGGSKWFLVNFIEWQYGELNAANRAHNSVLAILKANGITYPFETSTEKKEGASKPLASPLQGAMDMDMDKDMDTGLEEKERANEKPKTATRDSLPFASTAFAQAWSDFDAMRRQSKHRAAWTDAARRMILTKCERMGEAHAIEALNKSTVNGWRDVFDPNGSAPRNGSGVRGAPPPPMDRNAPIESQLFKPLRK